MLSQGLNIDPLLIVLDPTKILLLCFRFQAYGWNFLRSFSPLKLSFFLLSPQLKESSGIFTWHG